MKIEAKTLSSVMTIETTVMTIETTVMTIETMAMTIETTVTESAEREIRYRRNEIQSEKEKRYVRG